MKLGNLKSCPCNKPGIPQCNNMMNRGGGLLDKKVLPDVSSFDASCVKEMGWKQQWKVPNQLEPASQCGNGADAFGMPPPSQCPHRSLPQFVSRASRIRQQMVQGRNSKVIALTWKTIGVQQKSSTSEGTPLLFRCTVLGVESLEPGFLKIPRKFWSTEAKISSSSEKLRENRKFFS